HGAGAAHAGLHRRGHSSRDREGCAGLHRGVRGDHGLMANGAKVRAVVVGTGHMGQYHVLVYAELPDVELVGVVDADLARAAAVAAQYDTRVFPDHRALVGRVDVASVAVPTGRHFEVARDLLEAGISTLAITMPDAYVHLDYTDQDIRIYRRANQQYTMSRKAIRYSRASLVEHLQVHRENPLKLEIQHLIAAHRRRQAGQKVELNLAEDLTSLAMAL